MEIFSRGRDEDAWTLHAQGRVSAGVGQSDSAGRADLEALGSEVAAGSVDAVYEAFAARGLELGPSFRVLESIRFGEQEAVAELALREDLAEDGSHAHSTLLDGCIQALAALLPRGGPSYLPFGWEQLWLAGQLPKRLVCRARLRSDAGGAEEGAVPEVLTADLDLYAADGAALGGVSGLAMKRATRAALLASAEAGGGLLYRMAWREQAEVGPEALPEGAVLVTGGSETSAGVAALEAALARRGVRALAGSGEDPGRLLDAAQEAGDLAGVGAGGACAGRGRGAGRRDAAVAAAAGAGAAGAGRGAGVRAGSGDGGGRGSRARGTGGPGVGERVGIRAEPAVGTAQPRRATAGRGPWRGRAFGGRAAGGRGIGGAAGRRRGAAAGVARRASACAAAGAGAAERAGSGQLVANRGPVRPRAGRDRAGTWARARDGRADAVVAGLRPGRRRKYWRRGRRGHGGGPGCGACGRGRASVRAGR